VSDVARLWCHSYIVQQEYHCQGRPLHIHAIVYHWICLAAALIVMGPYLASFYGEAALERYLDIAAWQLVAGAFYVPIGAMLQRDMAFGKLAIVEIVITAAGAAMTIALAWYGFGALSFAWSGLLQSVIAGAMPLYFRRISGHSALAIEVASHSDLWDVYEPRFRPQPRL
jgi:hypothetical protein